MNVVSLYPNIPHEECLVFLCKLFEIRLNKQISSDILAELGEVVLRNVIFEFDEKTFTQKRGTAIRTKFAPPYAIFFIEDFEELESFGKKPIDVQIYRYIDDIFFPLGAW